MSEDADSAPYHTHKHLGTVNEATRDPKAARSISRRGEVDGVKGDVELVWDEEEEEGEVSREFGVEKVRWCCVSRKEVVRKGSRKR